MCPNASCYTILPCATPGKTIDTIQLKQLKVRIKELQNLLREEENTSLQEVNKGVRDVKIAVSVASNNSDLQLQHPHSMSHPVRAQHWLQ